MSLFCGSDCQERKDIAAQASLLQAQAQANLLDSLSRPKDRTWMYILAAVFLLLAVGLVVYLNYFKKI